VDFQQVISIIISVVVLLIVILPFFTGKGGSLASASAINDPDKLRGLKKAILSRYLEEEKAYEEGAISQKQWAKRSELLANRFIDVARRLDFVEGAKNS